MLAWVVGAVLVDDAADAMPAPPAIRPTLMAAVAARRLAVKPLVFFLSLWLLLFLCMALLGSSSRGTFPNSHHPGAPR